MSPTLLLILYLCFRLKHFTCDFLLQTTWMATSKGKAGIEGYKALFAHTAIHAVGTLLIVLIFAPALWWLSIVDFIIHSIVDRLKGKFTIGKHLKPKDTLFWWAFGFDQEMHNLTHIGYISIIFMNLGGNLL